MERKGKFCVRSFRVFLTETFHRPVIPQYFISTESSRNWKFCFPAIMNSLAAAVLCGETFFISPPPPFPRPLFSVFFVSRKRCINIEHLIEFVAEEGEKKAPTTKRASAKKRKHHQNYWINNVCLARKRILESCSDFSPFEWRGGQKAKKKSRSSKETFNVSTR